MRTFITIAKILAIAGLSLLLLEYALRTVRSLFQYGALYLSSPSADVEFHPKYGWISPSLLRVKKDDDCYGRGWVTYNDAGFRAPPMSDARDSDLVICILGDSTVHAFQIPDGQHLSHLLDSRLRQQFARPFVLPLAVGGYGSAQQWMLFEEYCRDLNPAVVIQHWCANDMINNSYVAERYSGPANNNARPRPYLEDGELVVRRPYPVHFSDWIDGLLIARAFNSLGLQWTEDPELASQGLEEGWHVAEEVTRRLSESIPIKIALVEETEERAIEMFRRHSFVVATYSPFTANETCLPNDPHPNSAGHHRLLTALWPSLDDVLRRTAPGTNASRPWAQSGGGDREIEQVPE